MSVENILGDKICSSSYWGYNVYNVGDKDAMVLFFDIHHTLPAHLRVPTRDPDKIAEWVNRLHRWNMYGEK